ncbi:hypothetical protein IDH44_13385 [Paenibacillus sp. IB182496]|uniref:Uncharacterized protein n=1 Tax=Paenibacillus sabuli TaxID=2772509 RepID=A0A927BSY1_9BACL|nr:hypothetical protein [Paenibacillus sabuli]MBD2846193.1 hypothetical protein [Paenibacillus sabuli]
MDAITMQGFRSGVQTLLEASLPELPVTEPGNPEQLTVAHLQLDALPIVHTPATGWRARRSHVVNVRYAAPQDTQEEALAVAERLTDALERVQLGSQLYRCSELRVESAPDGLRVTASYAFDVLREHGQEPAMQRMTHDGAVSG